VSEERRGWARTCVWKCSDCKNMSSCWEITARGPVEGVLRFTDHRFIILYNIFSLIKIDSSCLLLGYLHCSRQLIIRIQDNNMSTIFSGIKLYTHGR
jgi:hypothetical protein